MCGGFMTFEINGSNGYYDGKISDPSVRYGRNSVMNHKELVASTLISGLDGAAPVLDFSLSDEAFKNNVQKVDKFIKANDDYLKSLPPAEYEYRYMPKPIYGNIDKKALYAAAYEEMGGKEISIDDFDKNFLPNQDYSSKPLDLNKDGKIDVSEYSASLLAADILSSATPATNKVNGVINLKGMDIVVAYCHKSKAEAAVKMYSKIYDTYKLNELA